MRIICPHCRTVARVTDSEQLTATYKRARCQCTRVECGHTFVVDVTSVLTLSPSALPDPSVDLPRSNHPRVVRPPAPSPAPGVEATHQ